MSETSSEAMGRSRPRPLSPHLQVYKPQMTSVLSILHRMTGVALTVGLLMFAWWIVAAAYGEMAYNQFSAFARSELGLFLLFGFSVSFFYHFANGIRHLIWDAGYLFKIKNAYMAGYFVLFFTAACTAATWYCLITQHNLLEGF